MEISQDSIEAQGFTGRKEELAKIWRWDKNYFKVVFYRSNDLMHTIRVNWMLDEVREEAIKFVNRFNQDYSVTYALVHDDSEIITGDILGMIKSRMNQDEIRKYEQKEMDAIEALVSRWPKQVNGFLYRDLLCDALRKESCGAQLVSYLDKLDSLCESWHEVLAGNKSFYEGYGGQRPPLRGSRIIELRTKYEKIRRVLECTHPFLAEFRTPDAAKIINYGELHTSNSIYRPTSIVFYDTWKEMILRRGGQEGLKWLIEQREFEN